MIECQTARFCVILTKSDSWKKDPYFSGAHTRQFSQVLIDTYSVKTYVLLHFEHKNHVTTIVKLCIELRAAGEQFYAV